MSNINVHVRGQMGVQIIQAFVGLAGVNDNETPTLVVNTGGGLSYDASERLSLVFDVECGLKESDETRKSAYWLESRTHMAFKTRKRTIERFLHPRNLEVERLECVVHLRGKDKRAMKNEGMLAMCETAMDNHGVVHVCTDDRAIVQELGLDHRFSVSHLSAIEDWKTILCARNVYCAPSAFVLSTLLIDPSKRVVVGPIAYCDRKIIDGDLAFIEEAQPFCPSLECW